MSETNTAPIILVVFYCRNGEAEKLALAAAVGAVQQRANIRLRRLEDSGAAEPGGEELKRRQKEYVPPTERDLLAADGVVFAASIRDGATFPEWTHWFGLLGRLRDEGKIDGKVGGVVSGEESTLAKFSAAMLNLGFVTAPAGAGEDVERATAQGRRVASIARGMKRL